MSIKNYTKKEFFINYHNLFQVANKFLLNVKKTNIQSLIVIIVTIAQITQNYYLIILLSQSKKYIEDIDAENMLK